MHACMHACVHACTNTNQPPFTAPTPVHSSAPSRHPQMMAAQQERLLALLDQKGMSVAEAAPTGGAAGKEEGER